MGRGEDSVKVLVTGGGGFLGSAICRQLLARGDQVIAFQRSTAVELQTLGAQVVQGDITQKDHIGRHLAGCDAVIHTAGKAGAWGAYERYHAINVTGTDNVISACREHGVTHLVHTSSPSVAHGGGDIEGGDESLPYPQHFHAAYPETKAKAEQMVVAADGHELATVSLRPHLIWGPGDPHLLPRLLERAARGSIALPGGDKLIDTVYVDNAAEAHLLALDALREGRPIGGKVYFITNDDPRPQKEIIGSLLEAAGVRARIKSIPPVVAGAAGRLLEAGYGLFGIQSEPPVTRWSAEQLSTAHWYDISAAKHDLGYRPRISIEEGMALLARHLSRDS
jgi:nucleoside-diphosphate-sugar epimerase